MPAEISKPAPSEEAKPKRKHRKIDPVKALSKYRIDREQMSAAIYHLMPRERLFVAHVAGGMKHEHAVLAAGYALEGGALNDKAYSLMKKPLIRAAIYQAVSGSFARASIETDQTLRELATIAFMPDHMLEGRPRWQDKLRALELIGRFQRLLDKHVQHEGEISVVDLIRGSARRERAILEHETATPATFDEKAPEKEPEKVNGAT